MKKPISKKQHGLIDYSYALVVPALPHLAGFEKDKKPALLCYGLGTGALTYSLLTKASWGLIPVIPFKKHLALDFSASCLAIVSPWLFGFSANRIARNTLIAVGVAGLAASLLTNPKNKKGRR